MREKCGNQNHPPAPSLTKEGENGVICDRFSLVKYLCPEEARTSMGNLKYYEDLRSLAKYNRNNPTPAEKLFWLKLKKYKYTFLRQKPIYRFIVDFYCSKLLLVIEIDGGYHDKQKGFDDGREELLYKIGIKTIRFSNDEVINNIDLVFIKFDKLLEERIKEMNYSPSLVKEGVRG